MAARPRIATRKLLLEVLEGSGNDPMQFREAWVALWDGDEALAHELLWRGHEREVFVVWEHRAVAAFLASGTLTIEHSKRLAARLMGDEPERARPSLLEAWPEMLDALVYRCYRSAPSPFRKVANEAQPWAKRGLAFVQRRAGEPSEPAVVRAVVESVAEIWVRGRMRGATVAFVDERGEEGLLELVDPQRVGMLLRVLDPTVDAQCVLERAVREHAWTDFADVAPILETAPLPDVATALARESRLELTRPLAVLDHRDDAPAALLAAARDIPSVDDDPQHPQRRRAQTLLAVVAAERALRHGDAAPDDLEQLVVFAHAAEAVALARRLLDVLRRLPADRVNTWARARLVEDGAVVLAFAAHGDEEIVRDALREGGPVEPALFELLGAPAIPVLLASANALRDERAARARHAFVFALASAVAAGVAIEPAWDLELLIAAFEGRPTERTPYSHALEAALMRVFPALPRARREALLHEALDPAPMAVMWMLAMIESDDELDGYLRTALARGMIDTTTLRRLGARALPALRAYGPTARNPAWVREQAEQAFSPEQFATVAPAFEASRGRMWQTIADEAARACAASPASTRKRVYLLEPASFRWPARAGSRSRYGGRAPGSRAPSGMFHLMTIDLAEVPELLASYPTAGALSVFCTRFDQDEPDAEVVELDKAPEPANGQELAIFGFDVPAEVFGDPDNLTAEQSSIRARITHASSFLLGAPLWWDAKPYDEDDHGFVAQISEAMDDRLNFGDGGALYIFKDATIFQGL